MLLTDRSSPDLTYPKNLADSHFLWEKLQCCFSDVFMVAEVRLALKILILPILGFVDLDCPQL